MLGQAQVVGDGLRHVIAPGQAVVEGAPARRQGPGVGHPDLPGQVVVLLGVGHVHRGQVGAELAAEGEGRGVAVVVVPGQGEGAAAGGARGRGHHLQVRIGAGRRGAGDGVVGEGQIGHADGVAQLLVDLDERFQHLGAAAGFLVEQVEQVHPGLGLGRPGRECAQARHEPGQAVDPAPAQELEGARVSCSHSRLPPRRHCRPRLPWPRGCAPRGPGPAGRRPGS